MITLVVLLFILLDPFGNLAPVCALLRPFSPARRRQIILRESLLALGVLIAAAFAGGAFIRLLDLGPQALGIAAGIVTFIIAIGMVFPQIRILEPESGDEPFVVPIAIPFLAGPSTISMTILMSERHLLWEVLAAVLIAWSLAAAILAAATALYPLLGRSGARAVERLMGMLLVVISVDMVLDALALAKH